MRRGAAGFCIGTVMLSIGALVAPAAAQTATASISGRVTAQVGGTPIAGVCVLAIEGAGNSVGDATTDASGNYSITGLPAGSYVVAFGGCPGDPPGFAGEYFQDAATIDDADPVAVTAGQARTGLDAALAPEAVISGRVTGPGSAPAGGVCVTVFESATGIAAFEETAADGTYRVGGLAAGEYAVVFNDCSAPQNLVSEVFDNGSLRPGSSPEPTPIVLTAGQVRSGVDASLEEGGRITGRVTAAHTGQGVAFVCLAVRLPSGGEPLPSVSGGPDDPGEIVIGGIPAGTYTYEVNPADCGDDGYANRATQTVTITTGQATAVAPVEVRALPSIRIACGPPAAGEPFPDVPESNVHATAIGCAVDYDVARGRADGSYGPSLGVQRDQMASFVARAMEAIGVELPAAPQDRFPDDNGNIHELAVNQLAQLGVVSGRGGRYDPSGRVSRGEMAAFLVRAYEVGVDLQLRAGTATFPDTAGTTFRQEIAEAANAGMVAGTASGRYEPAAPVQRDQMATFLMRLVDRAFRDQL